MKNSVVRHIAALAAAASALTASLLTDGVASALPTGNYVAFGDSLAANLGQFGLAVPGRDGYLISASNIGSRVARETGLGLHDYSYNGITTFMPTQPQKPLIGQADNVITQGSLGPAIQLMTTYVGANDAMQDIALPMPIQDNLYTINVVVAAEKIKTANPTARVMLVGYPTPTSNDPAHYVCPVNAVDFAPHTPVVGMHDLEMALQNRQQRAANESGIDFVNMKGVAHIDVAMCDPDDERQVSAVLDADIASYNVIDHSTFCGSAVIGTIIANICKSTF